MAFEDFRKSILKLEGGKKHKITNSYGVRDMYNWCKSTHSFGENSNKITNTEFYKIIRTINRALAQQLIDGHDVKFPQKMGQLEVRKYDNYVKFVDGKLKTNRGINWNATIKLWFEDEEAKRNKTLVKVEDKETFIVFYNKMIANYNNKTLYQFKPHRELICAVKKAGKQGLIDAFKI